MQFKFRSVAAGSVSSNFSSDNWLLGLKCLATYHKFARMKRIAYFCDKNVVIPGNPAPSFIIVFATRAAPVNSHGT